MYHKLKVADRWFQEEDNEQGKKVIKEYIRLNNGKVLCNNIEYHDCEKRIVW